VAEITDFLRKLRQESKLWVDEEIISSEQQEKILSKYKNFEEAQEKAGSSKLITVISVMGSVLVGIGVILFIASNWGFIPRFLKLSIIFLSLFSSYALGYYLRYEKKNYPRVGGALILLGSIIFGAGIFLIAQIYNISVHYPNGPLMWALGVLPLAYLLKFKTILFLSLIDLIIWLPMELHFWVLPYRSFMVYISMYLLMGCCFFILGLSHSKFRFTEQLSRAYVILGSILTFGASYIFTFEVAKGKFELTSSLTPFLVLFSIIFLIFYFLNLSFSKKDKFILIESTVLLFLLLFGVFFVLNVTISKGDFFVFITNIIFALMIIGIIVLGFKKRDTAYINVGLLFFVLDIFARYFDFFFKLLPRSLFFIIGGLLLLFGGVFLEKKRRKVLSSFKLSEDKL
jgi:uncharacterized membrane protein